MLPSVDDIVVEEGRESVNMLDISYTHTTLQDVGRPDRSDVEGEASDVIVEAKLPLVARIPTALENLMLHLQVEDAWCQRKA